MEDTGNSANIATTPKRKLGKSDMIKRSLKAHMAGIGGNGLIYLALEKLATLVRDEDSSVSLAAIDKVVKLLPYCVSREDSGAAGLLGNNGGQPVNVQINFDAQISKRLEGTHLRDLMEGLGVVKPSEP